MTILMDFWGSLSYVGAVWIAALLVGFRLPRRRFFVAVNIILCLVLCLVSNVLLQTGRKYVESGYLGTFLSTLNCFMVFVAVCVCMRTVVYRCDWWQALFCTTAGYCMEHISQRASLFVELPFGELPFGWGVAVLVAARVIIYFVIYFFFIRKLDLTGSVREGKMQIAISMIAILLTVFLNAFASVAISKYGADELDVYIWMFSLMAGVLVLFVEFYQFSYGNAVAEREFLQMLRSQEDEQFRREKSAVDVLNVKCHDLKHQLAMLEQRYGREELGDIRRAVDAYDSFFHTGNQALDAVLTLKKLICEDKRIELTCLVDGGALSFMSDSDVYSLFGNILDNAVEAVEKLDDKRRVISVTVRRQNNFVVLHEENYCAGPLNFSDGLPETTKDDKLYHGFGLFSVRMLAEKYGGTCSVGAENGVFTVDMLFPVEG